MMVPWSRRGRAGNNCNLIAADSHPVGESRNSGLGG